MLRQTYKNMKQINMLYIDLICGFFTIKQVTSLLMCYDQGESSSRSFINSTHFLFLFLFGFIFNTPLRYFIFKTGLFKLRRFYDSVIIFYYLQHNKFIKMIN